MLDECSWQAKKYSGDYYNIFSSILFDPLPIECFSDRSCISHRHFVITPPPISLSHLVR